VIGFLGDRVRCTVQPPNVVVAEYGDHFTQISAVLIAAGCGPVLPRFIKASMKALVTFF
jgi:hypothetical protein